MTVIAWDGKTLAADTQWTSAYIQQHNTPKIQNLKTSSGCILWGSAGAAADGELFDAWVRGGRDQKTKPALNDSESFVAILVEGGRAYRYERGLFPFPTGCPSATGAGCEVAMGAMLAGADAKRAVEIAIKLCDSCGGGVTVLRADE